MADDRHVNDAQSDIPDIFVDTVALGVNPFSFTLRLYRSDPSAKDPMPGKPVGLVRFSPQMATALVKLLETGIERDVANSADQELTIEQQRGDG